MSSSKGFQTTMFSLPTGLLAFTIALFGAQVVQAQAGFYADFS